MAPLPRLFASHDWGEDATNHARVAEVVTQLRARGFDVWMDSSDMHGNIIDAMCRGIDASDVVLVFVTRNYLSKVESGDAHDNVRREFMYAAHTPRKLLPIRFDSALPPVWSGPLGMLLGHDLYVDMSAGGDVDALVATLETRQRAHRAPPPPPPSPLVRMASAGPGALARRPSGSVPRPIVGNAFSVPPTPAAQEVGSLVVCGMGIKERTVRVRTHYDGAALPGECSKDTIDRIFESIVGPRPVPMTFVQKLALVEQHLGI